MSTLAIGDIHGCLAALDRLLEVVDPEPDDRIITLGDYVDRGPDSRGVLDRLIELQDRCRLVALKGNHEVMMLQARNNEQAFREWCSCGGKQALESYGPYLDWETFGERIPVKHWRFLMHQCGRYHETETHIFVHANLWPDLPLDEQPDWLIFWEALDAGRSRPHDSGKVMVCGHTPQRSGRPLDLGHAVCIDTGIYRGGWLTCLDVGTGEYWQANQQGESRTGWLDDIPRLK
jgi:serine/threonine protein phosphatase 1